MHVATKKAPLRRGFLLTARLGVSGTVVGPHTRNPAGGADGVWFGSVGGDRCQNARLDSGDRGGVLSSRD